MKTILITILSMLISIVMSAQSLTEKKEFYDWAETKVKTSWFEKGDGTKHGIEKGFYENGKIKYIHNWENGIWTSLKYYYQDGQTRIESIKSKNDEYNGQQLFYLFENGQRYLKAKANVVNNQVKEYYYYEKPNRIGWCLLLKDGNYNYIKYSNEGKELVNINFIQGKISGNIEDPNYDGFILRVKENNIISFISDGRETKEISNGIIVSEYPQGKLNWTLFRKKTYNYNFDVINEIILDLYNVQIALDSKVKEKAYKNENVWSPDPITAPTLNNIGKLANIIFEQYLEDSIKVGRNQLGVILEEVKYLKGKEVWTKQYWENGKIRLQTFAPTKHPKYDYNIQKTLYFNENGSLIKETEGNNFIIYNEKGEITDSKKLSDSLNISLQSELRLLEKILQKKKTNDEYVQKHFCFNPQTSDFNDNCYEKQNQNIVIAFQTLYKEFLTNWNDLYKIGESKGYFENNLKTLKSIKEVPRQLDFIVEWNKYNSLLNEKIELANNELEKVKSILKNEEEIKIYNKKLKKIMNTSEIRNILSL